MDILTKISVVLVLCGIGHAKDLNPKIIVQGNNAIVCIDALLTDGKTTLEIYFSGYVSNLHFTNVMLYQVQNENISINSNYTGRIQRIEMQNGHFSFLLLNVNFKDSGNYTVKESSFEKGKTSVLVARKILPAQPGERVTLSFIFNETTMSSIKIDHYTARLNRPVLIFNASKPGCISTDVIVENCALEKGAFSFTIQKISWLQKGGYFAWDDQGRLLDYIVVDVQDNNKATSSSLDTEKETGKRLLISALVVALVATCLVIIAVRKHRIKRIQKTTTHNLTYRNGNQTIANSFSNECQNLEKAFIPEETRIVLRKSNSEDLTDFKNNKVLTKVSLNDKNIYARGLDCAKSSMRTACKLQLDSKLSLSETAHGHDYVHEDELKTDSLTDCLSKEAHMCSNLSGKKTTKSTGEPSFEYDYVVQHTFMTLRPPAPDPVVTKKNKQQPKIAKFLYSFKNVNKKSLSRVLPSTLYARLEKKRAKETHCTGSSVELQSLDVTNELSAPCSFELENDFAKKAIDSPKLSKHGGREKRTNANGINSHIFMQWPESSKLQDTKTRTLSRCLSFDYPRNGCDHASAMKRGHQRSRSHGALYGDLLINSKV